MIDSATIGGWIAHLTFWGVIAWGWAAGDLAARVAAVFVTLWLAGLVALRYLSFGALFPSFVAVLDIALVLMVFKADIRIS